MLSAVSLRQPMPAFAVGASRMVKTATLNTQPASC
jgi:hypothetical protein